MSNYNFKIKPITKSPISIKRNLTIPKDYINATFLAEIYNLDVNDYLELPETLKKISKLDKAIVNIQENIALDYSLSGKWIHPDLIKDFVKWISPNLLTLFKNE